MKNLLILVLLLGLAYYLFYRDSFNFKGFSLGSAAPVVETAPGAATHDFNAVSAMLTQDMNNIPTSLDAEAPRPSHAIDVRNRLRPHVNLHPEYQVLTQVCDLIIQADNERTSLQQSAHSEQSRASFHSALEQVDPKKHGQQSDVSTQQAAIRQRMESTWGGYRAKTADEVERLLGTLKGKTI